MFDDTLSENGAKRRISDGCRCVDVGKIII